MFIHAISSQEELDALLESELTRSKVYINSLRSEQIKIHGEKDLLVVATGGSTVNASGSLTIDAINTSTVNVSGRALVNATNQATVNASGQAMVNATGYAVVNADEGVTVYARGYATVNAQPGATVHAASFSTVNAQPGTTVHTHSQFARVNGVTACEIKSSNIDINLPTDWIEYTGATVVDGKVRLYKALPDDLVSGRFYGRDTKWPINGVVTCTDWVDGHTPGGGLHLSPHPWEAQHYYFRATRMLLCEAPIDEIRPIGSIEDVAKCKVRTVTVLREVNMSGGDINDR